MSNTCSKKNPKPGMLVNLGNGDYVLISNYRITRQLGRGCWHLRIADAEGKWGKPKFFWTKRAAELAMQSHIGGGKAEVPRMNLAARVQRLEHLLDEVGRQFHLRIPAIHKP